MINFTHEFNALSTENRSISCTENPSRSDKLGDILQETQRTPCTYTASIVTMIAWDVVIIALSALRQYLQAGPLCDAVHVFCLYTQLRHA